MRQWEYRLITTKDLPGGGMLGLKDRDRAAIEAHLNELGREGWEIVSADFVDGMSSPSHFQALAKRER